MSRELNILLLLTLLIVLVGAGRVWGQGLADQGPNIVFILADDLSYRDLSIYGQAQYQTPNLDYLASTGMRFSQAYSASPECAPSRGSLMTGMHTGHSSIRMNSSARGQEYLLDEDITAAEVLKNAGYQTAFFGKWGMGLPGSEGVPYRQGFDHSFGFYDQARAHTFIPDYLWENDQKIYYPENKGFEMFRRYDYAYDKAQNTYDSNGRLFISELKDPYGYTYSENEIEKRALKFINEQKLNAANDPFFVYYATQLPHGPVIVDDLGALNAPDTVNQLSREWGAMVVKLDDFVGELINTLKENGQYENTIIFFASDNGYSMSGYTSRGNGPDWPDDPWLKNKGPFDGGKFSVLEGGCRIPFFVHWKGKIAPSVLSIPVWLPDFFATAVELSGQRVDDYPSDGVSLKNLLFEQQPDFDTERKLYFSKGPEQAVRMGSWKGYRKSPGQPLRLYLPEEDTYTRKDLSSYYPEVVKEMEDFLDKSHTPHPWYWNPDESAEDFQEKKKKAKKSGEVFPIYYPNGISSFPWEK